MSAVEMLTKNGCGRQDSSILYLQLRDQKPVLKEYVKSTSVAMAKIVNRPRRVSYVKWKGVQPLRVMKDYNCIVSVLSLQSIRVCAAIFCSIEVNYCYIYMYATAITATISVSWHSCSLARDFARLV
jgi:hypothetical protein